MVRYAATAPGGGGRVRPSSARRCSTVAMVVSPLLRAASMAGLRGRGNLVLGATGRPPYADGMDAIRVRGLTKRYGRTLAVAGIDFAVPAGETVAPAGRQRGWQDHDDRDAARPADPDRGQHHRARPRHGARPVRGAGADELLLALCGAAAPADASRENLRVYCHLYNVRGTERGSRSWRTSSISHELLRRPAGAAFRRAEDARGAGEGADQPAGAAAARRADAPASIRTRRIWCAATLERYRAESGCTMLLASHNMARGRAALLARADDEARADRGPRHARRNCSAATARDDLEEVFLDIARDRRAAEAVA